MYKGQLEGFPPEIVEKMLYYQEKQGNKRDVSVFEKRKDSYSSGFCWDSTEEKFDFWDDVINNKNFDLFFEKYPKQDVLLEIGKYYKLSDINVILKVESDIRTWIHDDKKHIGCKGYRIWIDERCFKKDFVTVFVTNDGDWGRTFQLANEQEIEHLNQCIKAGKYVDIKTYEYEVVHCETQEQWDFVIDKLQPNSFSKSWFKPDLGICFKNFQWCEIDWYKNRNSLILSFQEWCHKFGHTFEEEFKVGDWVVLTYDNFEDIKAGGIFQIKKYDKKSNIYLINKYWVYPTDIRKALQHEIPQSLNPCQDIVLHKPYWNEELNKELNNLITKLVADNVVVSETQDEITITTKEYKVEDGYLPYPEQPVNLSLILSSLNY